MSESDEARCGEWTELLGPGVKICELDGGSGSIAAPEFGHLVMFDWTGRPLADGNRVDQVFDEESGAQTRIGDGDVMPGLELALRHMKVGQRCLVHCEARYAFGPDGCPAIKPGHQDLPADSDVELEVHLREVVSKEAPQSLSPKGKLREGLRKKSVGNGHFQRRDYKKAIRAYQAVLTSISNEDFPAGSEDVQAARKLLINCGNNVAFAYVRLGDLVKAKESAVVVLELDPNNTKALYRAGQIFVQQGDFDEAKLALQKALEIEPQSTDVRAELRNLAKAREAYRLKAKKVQQTMSRNLISHSEGPPTGPSQKQWVAATSGAAPAEPDSPSDSPAASVPSPPAKLSGSSSTRNSSSSGSTTGQGLPEDLSAPHTPRGWSLQFYVSLAILLFAVGLAYFQSRVTMRGSANPKGAFESPTQPHMHRDQGRASPRGHKQGWGL